MEHLNDKDFEIINSCPWCGSHEYSFLYVDQFGSNTVKCKNCEIVFSHRRLNKSGLDKYWKDYLSRIQIKDKEYTNKRLKMYEIDYDYIHSFLEKGKILDIGCGNGTFMDYFIEAGYIAEGVEFGEEAANVASKKHKIYYGEFPKLNISNSYDLIIFRGTLQYFPNPKSYINKAISLLNKGGLIYITAQPNIDSFCFNLFKENFSLAVTASDFWGYNEKILTKYMNYKNLIKVGEKYFYEETPYADIEKDILTVAKAIEYKRENKEIDFFAPAFYGNMMSLVYKKEIINE